MDMVMDTWSPRLICTRYLEVSLVLLVGTMLLFLFLCRVYLQVEQCLVRIFYS